MTTMTSHRAVVCTGLLLMAACKHSGGDGSTDAGTATDTYGDESGSAAEVTKVRFSVELLVSAETAPEREQWLTRAQSGCDRLDEIVDELLDHVRIADPEEPGGVAVVDVVSLVQAVADEVDDDGIAVEVLVGWSGTLPVPTAAVSVGPRSLKRVVRNLVDNAQYWGRQRVRVELSLSDARLTLSVEDDGPGIAVADRKRVLEPFETDRGADGGLGLGLALVARIALQTDAMVALDQSEALGGCRAQLTWTYSAASRVDGSVAPLG